MINKRSSASAHAEPLRKEANPMYGYLTPTGYMGLVDGQLMLFATESDYEEYLR